MQITSYTASVNYFLDSLCKLQYFLDSLWKLQYFLDSLCKLLSRHFKQVKTTFLTCFSSWFLLHTVFALTL
jgi:hypothetical protein